MATTKKTTTRISIRKSDYPHLSSEAYKNYMARFKKDGQTERQIKNNLAKKDREIGALANQPAVEKMTIEIEWKKNSMWGSNPTAGYRAVFANGQTDRVEKAATASGAGYDKESTVIASIFNMLCVGMAMKKIKTASGKKNKPYGVYDNWTGLYFDGGIGVGAYYRITEWLGGKMVPVASTKTTTVYEFTFKKPRKK